MLALCRMGWIYIERERDRTGQFHSLMFAERPHRRRNPLTGEWILVSPHRTKRPWLGQVETHRSEGLPPYDPMCYLCPGNERAGGIRNPPYTSTYAFDNDFAAVLPRETAVSLSPMSSSSSLFVAEHEDGCCRVICFSPRHDLTLPRMTKAEISEVVRTWAKETEELGSRPDVTYVQVFENKGDMMGCSNPHPHCQIWATTHIPNEPAKELRSQREYMDRCQGCLLCETLGEERRMKTRIVLTNEHFTVVVPFWATWPFEVLLLSHRHLARVAELTDEEVTALADILRRLTTRYDNLFCTSFPYSMGLHQSPFDGSNHPEWHFHAHFYPPLLRSATVKKHMVGFELLGMPQRDITPEQAAERLSAQSEHHFSLSVE